VRAKLTRGLYLLGLLWHYGLQRQKVEMAYPLDFLINITLNVMYSLVQIFFIWALFYRTPLVAGWTFEQMVLIYGMGQVSFGYFSVVLFELTVGFSDYYIIEGNLDRPLLRPLSPLLQLVMENITLRDLTVILKGTLIAWWALAHLEPAVPFTLTVFLAIQGLALIGATVYAGVFLSVASTGFWIKDRTGLSSPFFSVSEASRYPLTIYHPLVQLFFSLVVPFGFCAFYPAAYFIDPGAWRQWLLAGPLIAAASLALGVYSFQRGLKVYESTGS
jgi:ABC-2 type transport system permease protein